MKIRTIITAAVTGMILVSAGSSLAFAADWTCPRGYANCTGYEYCTTHDHGDCDGYWSDQGDWVCPDGTHSWCASGSGTSACQGPASRSGSSSDSRQYRHHSESRSGGHHSRQGCGTHHRS